LCASDFLKISLSVAQVKFYPWPNPGFGSGRLTRVDQRKTQNTFAFGGLYPTPQILLKKRG